MPSFFTFCKKLPSLTDEQIKIIEQIDVDRKDYRKFKNILDRYLEFEIDLKILVGQWPLIQGLNTHNSSSIEVYQIRYGIDHGSKLHADKTSSCIQTTEKYQAKYGVEAQSRLSRLGASLDNYISRYGCEEGISRWNAYIARRSKTYKAKRGQYAKRNLNWFVAKYGQDRGHKIWDQKRKQQAHKVSLAGYIEKYGEEEGKIRCKQAKSRSLSSFVSRYGQDIGTQKYNKWRMKNCPNKYTASKWSLEIIQHCRGAISDLYYYGENEMVWQLSQTWQDMIGTKCICPDSFYRGKIIEFQGDRFHANPILFKANSYPHPYRRSWSAQDIWNKDRARTEYYRSKKYKVIEIWEDDYKQNQQEVIDRCINFLLN